MHCGIRRQKIPADSTSVNSSAFKFSIFHEFSLIFLVSGFSFSEHKNHAEINLYFMMFSFSLDIHKHKQAAQKQNTPKYIKKTFLNEIMQLTRVLCKVKFFIFSLFCWSAREWHRETAVFPNLFQSKIVLLDASCAHAVHLIPLFMFIYSAVIYAHSSFYASVENCKLL